MAELATEPNFDLAMRHHRAGRLKEADQLYRQILTQNPRHAPALHYLGVLAYQAGQNNAALDLIRRAIALAPNDENWGLRDCEDQITENTL
jgi:tetratricopeptide (TPR) repeat protein